jgi:hydroxymethylbilane synthase
MKRVLKLGTRKSLLAWAQSGQVAREIERRNAGLSVELVGIETMGDKILDVSLREVAGKEFFVAELDEALLAGRVDLSVHSMKDLSLDRPQELVLAAIPARANPRDVILFSPDIEEKIARGKALKIGTSSPRRLENIPRFLRRVLPQAVRPADVKLVEIRGNVNTRLARVREPESSERALDGVVLAFAGLIRLWADAPGRMELERLLEGVRWMVLPLRECPAAPAQGALAIECRANDSETRAALEKLHDPATEKSVKRERDLLAEFGGGCHQAFGATSIPLSSLGPLFFVRGRKPDGSAIDEFDWKSPVEKPETPLWDGSANREAGAQAMAVESDFSASIRPGRSVFIAHSRAVLPGFEKLLNSTRNWTSGVASWERLAKKGLWIEGCAESLGFEFVIPTLESPVLGLAKISEWIVLTHEAAAGDWLDQQLLATYRLVSDYPSSAIDALKSAREVFWSSGSQYDALKAWVRPDARHACGAGKTAKKLRDHGIDPLIFPSREEWRRWVQNG